MSNRYIVDIGDDDSPNISDLPSAPQLETIPENKIHPPHNFMKDFTIISTFILALGGLGLAGYIFICAYIK
jgi:hypothetical protein